MEFWVRIYREFVVSCEALLCCRSMFTDQEIASCNGNILPSHYLLHGVYVFEIARDTWRL